MVRGGRFTSSTVDHLVEREHADAEYTRDCNYRLISFSILLHVLLFVFFSLATFPEFFFYFHFTHFSIITEVSYVGNFLRFYTHIYVHHLSLSADRGIVLFFVRWSSLYLMEETELKKKTLNANIFSYLMRFT